MAHFVMSLTLAEFERQLRPLATNWAVHRRPGGWYLQSLEQSVDLVCRPLPAQRLGALELPRLDVAITFADDDPAGEAAFLDNFRRHFGRGGG